MSQESRKNLQDELNELQQLAYTLEMMEAQVGELQAQYQIIDQGYNDLKKTIESVEDLEKIEGESEALVPLGSNAFVRVPMKKPETILVSIGARYFVEQPPGKSKDLLRAHQERLGETRSLIEERIKQLSAEIGKIRPFLEQRLAALQQQGLVSAGQGQGDKPRTGKINLDDLG